MLRHSAMQGGRGLQVLLLLSLLSDPAGALWPPGLGGAPLVAARLAPLRLRGGASRQLDDSEFAHAGKTMRGMPHLVDEWIEQNFPLQDRKEFGHACLGLGAVAAVAALTPLPLGCFMSRRLLLTANALLTAGAFLVSGPLAIRRFLFAPRRRVGSIILAAGVSLVYKQWTTVGVVIEIVGFLGLFGPFLEGFPLVVPALPSTTTGLVSQLRILLETITAPFRKLSGASLELERREW